jgi:hypothetical protein
MEYALGFVSIIVGILFSLYPYKTARFEERLDGIGSKRSWSEIEPADWKVLLNRFSGLVAIAIGVILIAFAY